MYITAAAVATGLCRLLCAAVVYWPRRRVVAIVVDVGGIEGLEVGRLAPEVVDVVQVVLPVDRLVVVASPVRRRTQINYVVHHLQNISIRFRVMCGNLSSTRHSFFITPCNRSGTTT